MKRFFMILFMLSVISATGAVAERKSGSFDNPKQIPDSIIITANRSATPLAETGSSITVINEEEIATSQVKMVADLLRQVPGVDVVSSGGAGRQTAVYLRGANSHHTLVVIDGVEMNDPSSPNSAFDFAHLNVDNIQRVEILRGAQSVLYGSDAIGGVIQIFTKRGIGGFQANIVTEAGSFGSFSETAHFSGNTDNLDYSVFLSRKDSDGFSVVKDGVEKDSYENSELTGQIGYQINKDYEFTFTGKMIDGKADLDQSSGILDDPNFRTESDIRTYGVKFQKTNASRYLNPMVGVSFSKQEHLTVDEVDANHLSDASEYSTYGLKRKYEIQNKMKLQHSEDFRHHLNIGFETELDRYQSAYSSESFYGPYGDTVTEVSSRTSGLFLLNEIAYQKALFLTAGIRYDDHEQFGKVSTFRLTAAYLFRQQGLTLKGNYGTGFKSPSLYQIHHPVYGNKHLEPEKSKSWEVGFEKQTRNKKLLVGMTYFHNDFNKLFGVDALTYQAVNIDEVGSEGVEMFSEFRFDRSSMRIDYTYTDIQNKSSDAAILRRPASKFTYTISHNFSKALFGKVQLLSVGDRVDVDYISYPSREVTLAGYSLCNVSFSYEIIDAVTITGRVENLFDERYEEIYSYNSPSRSISGGLQLNL